MPQLRNLTPELTPKQIEMYAQAHLQYVAKVEQDKQAEIDRQKKVEQSAKELGRFLANETKEGILQGNISHVLTRVILERAADRDVTTCVLVQQVLRDELFGLRRNDQGYRFHEKQYATLKELENAVAEYLGVPYIPKFNELVRKRFEMAGQPYTPSELANLLKPEQDRYIAQFFTSDDAIVVSLIESAK